MNTLQILTFRTKKESPTLEGIINPTEVRVLVAMF